MGEIADMMLDGTMDPETGEWNFDGEDGPGWPMTGAEAAAYRRATKSKTRLEHSQSDWTSFKPSKDLRKRIEKVGELVHHDPYHWQVRVGRKVLADWWPHKNKWRMAGASQTDRGNGYDFAKALERANADPS